MTDRMLRQRDVERMTGLSRTSIWRRERAGTFPRRRLIGGGLVAWRESEILAWMDGLPVATSDEAA